MKHVLQRALMAGLILILLAACAGSPAAGDAQPLSFNPAPWSDGEVSTYDVADRNGAVLGTAVWTWRRGPEGEQWTQSYELELSGRTDRGEVVMGADLRPISAWQELSGLRFEVTYGPDAITIGTTTADATRTTKTLKPPAGGVDNDQSLQVQRALPLAAGYATRYNDVVPTTGAVAPILLSVTGVETITVPAGTFSCWRVLMDFGSGKHDGWYGQAAPHPLVKYVNRASGAAFELRAITVAGQGAEGSIDLSGLPRAEVGGQEAGVGAPAGAGEPALNIPYVLAAALVQVPLMILLPLFLGWWLRRRYRAGWGIFLAGAGTFVLSQVIHLPLNWALGRLGGEGGVATWPLAPLALILGLSAGVCEEGARWLVLTLFLKRVRSWREGLQFGAGHGGAEAILLGLLALVNFIAMIALRTLDPAALNALGATADQVRAAVAQYWAAPWYLPIVGGLERVFAIILQITLALLVVRAVARRRIGYFLAALGLHAAVDAWAVWAGKTLGVFPTEAGVAAVALACLWLIWRLRGHDEKTFASEDANSSSAASLTAAPTAVGLAPRALSPEELARRADASRYE